MSTTMPSSLIAAQRNSTSTTKVAPCSRCAGPKTSPRKLCAIITWSRTVTLNMGLLGSGRVDDAVAQAGHPARGDVGHHLGQLLELRGAGEQGVERRVAEQVERERHPVGEGATTESTRCHRADLA